MQNPELGGTTTVSYTHLGHRRKAPDMSQQAGHKGIGFRGQLPLSVGIVEHVLSIPEQRHIDMHTGTTDAEDGLGHKRSVQTVALSQHLDSQLERHDVVRRAQGVVIFEVDLMLTGGRLVVRCLHLKAKLLQCQADLPAGGLAVIQRAQIEIAGLVIGLGGGLALLVGLEQEELALGRCV